MALPSTDPKVLVNLASCFDQCVPQGFHPALQSYLLALIAGVDTTNPRALVAAAQCFDQCIPIGSQTAVQNYLLSQLLS